MSKSTRHPARRRYSLVVATAAASILAVSLPRADAINIIMNYDSAGSVDPTWDSTGSGLQSIMNYVAGVYEDIFEDNHTITITYRWNNTGFDSSSTIAEHNLTSEGGSPHRETAGTINFNTAFSYFIDPTPGDNAEFTMTQTLWRDLSAANQGNFFNGTAPATFEVGFTGNAVAGGDAVGLTDLLSVAFHEVGHALGMSSANNATVSQTNDDDYDFNPLFVNGSTLAAVTASGTNVAHLAASSAVMQPSFSGGRRELPSHTDLFAMASGHAYTNLDVPRREFYGGSNWNAAGSWSGNKVPSTADESNVRNNATMGLSANGFAGALNVRESAWVSTNAFKLDVTGLTTIDGSSTLFAGTTRVRVQAGGELETSDLSVLGGAYLDMVGGTADILDDLTISTDSRITGYGTVQVAGTLRNDGLIIATSATTPLTITALGATNLNLDGTGVLLGSEPGQLTATSGSIVVNGPVETFNGTMTVGAGRSITFNTPWTLGGSSGAPFFFPAGTLDLSGGADVGTAATLAGAAATLDGIVPVSGFAIVSAPVNFVTPTVTLTAGSTLRLSGATNYNGGSYTGAGTIQQNGAMTVSGNTTIAVDLFDWDGTPGTVNTSVNPGVTLTLNVNQIDPGVDGYDGTVTLSGGSLAVNTPAPWRLDGTLVLTVSGGNYPRVTGSEIDVFGTIDANGNASTIEAPIDFQPAAAVTLTAASDFLSLTGPTTYRGGSYTGAGTLRQSGPATFAADTTIAVATFDWDGGTFGAGSSTLNPDTHVIINSAAIDQFGGAFDGTINVNSAVLTVNTAAPWSLDAAGTLNLHNALSGTTPSLGGQTVNVAGKLNSTGGAVAIVSAPVNFAPTAVVTAPAANDSLHLAGNTTYAGGSYTGAGTIRQTGNATVTANTTVSVGTFDLDGLSETSQLTVNSGVTLTVNSAKIDTAGGYNGTATVNSGTLAINTATPWSLEGTINLNKTGVPTPALAGAAEVVHAGTLSASGGATVSAPFRSAVTNTVNVVSNTLTFTSGFASNAGSTLTKTGAGTLRVTGPQTHATGATVNVNAGTLQLDTSADSAAGPNLRITVNPTGQAVFNESQRLDSLIIANNASATLATAGTRALSTTTLSITGTGFLELANNDAIVDYAGATVLATVRSYLATGYNAGNWNGPGIRSTAASLDANKITALAVAEASDVLGLAGAATALFSGLPADATSLLIKYTYYGDANLDGRVTRDDFSLTDRGLALGLTGWTNGDYNYDNAVNASDYLLLDKAYLLQSGAVSPELPEILALRQSQFGPTYAAALLVAIPEPSSSLVIPLVATMTARRQRQQRIRQRTK